MRILRHIGALTIWLTALNTFPAPPLILSIAIEPRSLEPELPQDQWFMFYDHEGTKTYGGHTRTENVVTIRFRGERDAPYRVQARSNLSPVTTNGHLITGTPWRYCSGVIRGTGTNEWRCGAPSKTMFFRIVEQ